MPLVKMVRMVKKSKVITDEDRLNMELQLESDLARFQRQHRNLERGHGTTTGSKMARQRRVIGILEKEESNIQTDLFVATGSTKKKEDERVTANVMSLLHEHDYFEEKINEKKNQIEEIDGQIFLTKKAILVMRARTTGDEDYKRKVLSGQKVVEALERKLDSAIKRFCTVQTQNAKLRKEIEHLLFERMNFNKLWDKMILNLSKGKKFMIDIIEQATIAYNEREECVTKLHALRLRGQYDLTLDSQEMIELQRHVDDYKKLREYLTVKCQKRIMRDCEQKLIIKKDKQRQHMQEHLVHCKEMLAEIMGFTGVAALEDIYSNFMRQEEQNFSMFNYINLVHKEIEELSDALLPLHVDIDCQRDLNYQRVVQQTDNLNQLNEELRTATHEADIAQAELDKTNNTLKKLYLGIRKLFAICRCSSAPFLELLGDNTAINGYNVALHLSMMEERINDLILKVYHNQKRPVGKKEKQRVLIIMEDQVAHPVHRLEAIVPTNPCPLCVDQDLVTCVIDTLQFVQTKEEVVTKLAQRLTLPDGLDRLHNVSTCHLPTSRKIIQRRYQ